MAAALTDKRSPTNNSAARLSFRRVRYWKGLAWPNCLKTLQRCGALTCSSAAIWPRSRRRMKFASMKSRQRWKFSASAEKLRRGGDETLGGLEQQDLDVSGADARRVRLVLGALGDELLEEDAVRFHVEDLEHGARREVSLRKPCRGGFAEEVHEILGHRLRRIGTDPMGDTGSVTKHSARAEGERMSIDVQLTLSRGDELDAEAGKPVAFHMVVRIAEFTACSEDSKGVSRTDRRFEETIARRTDLPRQGRDGGNSGHGRGFLK